MPAQVRNSTQNKQRRTQWADDAGKKATQNRTVYKQTLPPLRQASLPLLKWIKQLRAARGFQTGPGIGKDKL